MKAKIFSLQLNSTQVESLENVEIILNSGSFNFKVDALPDSGSNLNAIGINDVAFLGDRGGNPSAARPHHAAVRGG